MVLVTIYKDRPNPANYHRHGVGLLLILALGIAASYALAAGRSLRNTRLEFHDSDDDDAVVATARMTRTSTTANEDPFTKTPARGDPLLEPVDCLELLGSYRRGEIAQLKDHTDEFPIQKSYVRLTNTAVPFYLSTSDAKVDAFRISIFTGGDYYEGHMTTAMQTIMEDVCERMTERNDRDGGGRRPIMLDVGGNVGWFSMLSAAHGAEVFVFEPNVVNMIRLCESSVLNGWTLSSDPMRNIVHPYLKGVSDTHGSQEVMYKVDPRNPGSFSFSKENADSHASRFGEADTLEDGDKLQLITLDALALDQRWLDDDDNTTIAILKIDVEGLEMKVLLGARKLLMSRKVQYIFLEWKRSQVHRWEEMSEILLQSGYVIYKYGGGGGPNMLVTTKYANGKELAKGIAAISKVENTNVLFRLDEIKGSE